jgi:mono/diheme cytochrome c family protein
MMKNNPDSSLRKDGLFLTTLLATVCACLVLMNVCVRAVEIPIGSEAENAARSSAAFLDAYRVFMHPRCVNCHPVGDAPLQGENSRPHSFFRLRRGADGQGVFALKCTNCHQAQNTAGLHMPPGAGFPLKEGKEDPAHHREPRWRMPSAATPMIFEGRTAAQLCKQLLDKRMNGGLNPEQLIEHVGHDPFVLWGWNPGEGRGVPPISHAEFVQRVRDWVSSGSACPK